MSPLYLYAVVSEEPVGSPGEGLAGEPLRVNRCGSVIAVVGEQPERPVLDAATLSAHDAAVRRLATRVPAILPARFGEWVSGEHELADRLSPHTRDLAEALERVRGCEQMTLRVFGEPDPAPIPSISEDAGPGTRYLASRKQELEWSRSLPEIAALLGALRPLLRDERIERRATPPLIGTASHLVPRESIATYRSTVERADLGAHRVVLSGPWPPYAFAPRMDPRP